jgi:hypothetical protein
MADGPNDGVTGAGGAAEDTVPPSRLPVVNEPVFTTFGGAAGEGGSEPSPGASGGAQARGGNAAAGGNKPAAGGATTNGGTKGTGGTTTNGGTAANGGATAPGDGGAGGAGLPSAGSPALLFSEYVEGSGSFKALEIYAVAASSLEGCELDTYFNGKREPSPLALHGTLTAGGMQVLCSSTLATAQPSLCDRATNLTFNGDDALALSCGGIVLDVFGQIGVDPGDAWSMGATLDHTLRRRCSVSQGNRDGSQVFDIDAEWIVFGSDTFSGLGNRDCAVR